MENLVTFRRKGHFKCEYWVPPPPHTHDLQTNKSHIACLNNLKSYTHAFMCLFFIINVHLLEELVRIYTTAILVHNTFLMSWMFSIWKWVIITFKNCNRTDMMLLCTTACWIKKCRSVCCCKYFESNNPKCKMHKTFTLDKFISMVKLL